MQPSVQDRVTGRGFRFRRNRWALVFAGVAACGGTTGLEKILDSPDAPADPPPAGARVDGSAAPATNPLDAVPNDPFDAAPNDPLDATPDAQLYDRSVPPRPPPQDSGAPVTAGGDATPKRPATSSDSGRLTTLSILAAQSPDCLTLESDAAIGGCAGTNGCLDPALQGGVCETVPGMAKIGGISEAQLCLQTLQDIFSSNCAAAGSETPCLCGATNAMSCLAGTAAPAGAVYPDYVEDFGPNIANISAYFALSAYGAGQANAIVQCLQIFNCQGCLGTGVADAGAEASGP